MGKMRLKTFFDKLQDDESRVIFLKRLLFLLEEKYKHMEDMIYELEKSSFSQWTELNTWKESFGLASLKDFFDFCKNSRSLVAYGAGAASSALVAYKRVYSINISCICDNNTALVGTEKHGYPVISPKTLINEYMDANIVITTTKTYIQEIFEQLLNMGFRKEQIIPLPPLFYMTDEQYFFPDFIQPGKDEIYIDCGCFDGGTIKAFIEFTGLGNYKKIYGFEPDPVGYCITKDYVASVGINNIKLINKGVWSKDDVLSFYENSENSLIIEDGGTTDIPVTSIDDTVGDDAVTFIKMDVETAELEALKGAAKTIVANKPVIAISIYHKLSDILEIPLYLDSLVPDYKYFIRHYTLVDAETVLYAVP